MSFDREFVLEFLHALPKEERHALYQEVHEKGFEPYHLVTGFSWCVRLKGSPRLAQVVKAMMAVEVERDVAIAYHKQLRKESFIAGQVVGGFSDMWTKTTEKDWKTHFTYKEFWTTKLDPSLFEVNTEPLLGKEITKCPTHFTDQFKSNPMARGLIGSHMMEPLRTRRDYTTPYRKPFVVDDLHKLWIDSKG